MIRKTKNKRNPNSELDKLITTSIQQRGSNFTVSAFAGPSKILTIEGINSKGNADKISKVTKQTLEKELKSAKRSNPDYELEPSLQKAIGKSLALPDDKMESFELGRLYGIQVCLKKYCGALNFLKRRKVLKAVDNAISNSLGNLARTILVRGEGFEGPVPFVKKSTKSS